jgi:hypothetical protein
MEYPHIFPIRGLTWTYYDSNLPGVVRNCAIYPFHQSEFEKKPFKG